MRPLTPGEIELAREAFGETLDYPPIRFLPSPWPFDRAFVPGRWFGRDWIVWPKATLVADLSTAPLKLQSTFIHELTHVWQAQRGVNLLTAKLRAGDSDASYAYPLADDCDWDHLNIEQQAMVIEHRFRLSHGLGAPADKAFYDRVCPIHHH
ncbi:hypothetical protein [Brevundimonas sp. M20]|uniref:hypothetical protein n=1 Tax=Brevundimonas sp. M20 TaxID=2591463 RepID=UPI001146A6F4|nr:hypothetical protein [Brevundimonas sp. M20]QDH73269.1 hypothetical protein FKQ52_07415 [Brevundimonas sp. M20]